MTTRDGLSLVTPMTIGEPVTARFEENVHHFVGDAFTFPTDTLKEAAGGRFDIVLCAFNTLFNITDTDGQRRCLTRVRQLLAPDGLAVIEAFVPPMIAAGRGGHLVNVSSAAGLFGLPWHAAYSATKFGLRGVSEVLRFDLRPHGIRVSLVCPGAVSSPLVDSVRIVGVDREDPRVRAERDTAARARSGLDAALVAVERAELNLLRTRIVAPFAGRIANLKVVPGQYVNVGDELLTVQAMDPIRVDAKVLEGNIGFLAVGRTARVTFSAFPGEVFEGRIQTINPVVDPEFRNARVSISVRNPNGRILPGMFARATLPARRFPDRILVPNEAILERDNRRTLVFVFNGEGDRGRAQWVYVTPGLKNDTHTELVEDPETNMLSPGDIVLVGGHYTLSHDIPVRLVDNVIKAEGARPR